jgi:Na+/proline symporter
LRVGHAAVAFYAIICGLAGLIFFYIGVSLGWLYTFMGVILGSAVVPIALAVTWSKANKWGCIWGSIIGFFTGILAWLVATSTLNGGVINVVTSGGNFEMLSGNIASIGVGAIVATVSSLIWPADFDWEATRAINKPATRSETTNEKLDFDSDRKRAEVSEKEASVEGDSYDTIDDDLDPVALNKAFKFATRSSITLFIIFILVIPLPLFFSQYVYNVGGLTGWVAIGIAWTFLSAISVVLYPLYESRQALFQIVSGIYKDLFTKGSGKHVKAFTPTSAA